MRNETNKASKPVPALPELRATHAPSSRRDDLMVYPTCTYLNAEPAGCPIPRKARRRAKLNSRSRLALGILTSSATQRAKSKDAISYQERQPDKLNSSFGGAADGIYTRVLFAWPPEPAYQKLTDHVEEIEPELYNTLTRLIDLPAEQDDELLVSPVSLSPDARGAFEDFRKHVHTGKAALDGHDREWWAKTPTHVLRLSGTLAYLDPIPRDCARRCLGPKRVLPRAWGLQNPKSELGGMAGGA